MLRFFKVALIVIVIVAVAKTTLSGYLEKRADREIPKWVASEQASLPRMLNKGIRLDNVAYEGRTVRIAGASLITVEYSDSEKKELQEAIRARYCKNMELFWRSNVSIEYEIRIPPRSISDSVSTLTFGAQPKDCPENT